MAVSQHPPGSAGGLADRDVTGLLFAADMYGVQLDHLAGVLGVREPAARAAAARWRDAGYAETARIGPGPAWLWLTRAGLAACGLPYRAVPPALSRLAHLRAVTAVRLALETAPAYRQAGAYWRSERRLRARAGSRAGLREHLPDGEVHWPDGAGVPWAGECWAVEAELTRKTITRTTAIMREILTRTGDYGCPAAGARVPGRAPRHARVLYVCSPAALPAVSRAAAALGNLAGRVETRLLPPGAGLPGDPAADGVQHPQVRAPQAPGHGAALRASGTTQRGREAPQRCPGAEDQPREASEVFDGAPPARRTASEADR